MKLLVIVLGRVDKLEEVLSVLLELDISDATLLESEGMFGVLATEIPIFAGLRQLVTDNRSRSKTIFALTDREQVLQDMNRLLKEDGLDFEDAETGYMFTLPVDDILGEP